MKKYLHQCPQHGLSKHKIMQTFYKGIDRPTQNMIDNSVGGTIMHKTPNEAYKLIIDIAVHTLEWYAPQDGVRRRVVVKVVEANVIAMFNKKFDKLNATIITMQVGCESYGGPHLTRDCDEKPMRSYEDALNQKENDKAKSQSSPSTTRVKTPLKLYEPILPYLGQYKKKRRQNSIDLLANKKKLEDLSTVIMSEECSAILDGILPKKMSDPGSFTIPCLIENLSVHNALADLGSSINLMPYSIYAKLGLGDPKPTRMTIQLANKSIKYPRGIIENVLVKFDQFVFSMDFVILDMDEDGKVPLT
nr:hypothetical protein [Tanacetum cinerariifolium]